MITDPARYFYVNDGSVLKSIDDFLSKMNSIDTDTFRHHVNEEKNDFAAWTKEVLNDKMLARSILKTSSPNEVADAIKKRIHKMESLKNKKESKKSILHKIKEAHS